MDTHKPRPPQNAAKRGRGGQNPLAEVWAILSCPRIRDSVRLVQGTAILWFQSAGHIRDPDKPILGPTNTVSGPQGSKHGQSATQPVPKLSLSINLDNGTFWGPPRRHRGPFLVILSHFGPAWGPIWGRPRAQPLGRSEHFGSRETGLPGPKGDCLSSQHHHG